MESDAVVLQASQGGARLRLHSPTYVDAKDGTRVADELTIEVTSNALAFSARVVSCVLTPLSADQLHDVLKGFARLPEPWTYTPSWSAEIAGSGFVNVSAKCDRVGHIRVSVEVEDYGLVEWRARAELVYDLGQAEQHGRTIKGLTHPSDAR